MYPLPFFDREDYACRFVGGEIRVGLLERYWTIEGSRKDESEGWVSFYWNQKAPERVIDKATGQVLGQRESDQNIHYCGRSVNPHFVLCTSHPDVEMQVLVGRFGKSIVRIDDPTALLERIKTAWKSHAWALDGGAVIVPVVYNKDGLLDADPYLIAPPHLDYSQKSELFKEEREFR